MQRGVWDITESVPQVAARRVVSGKPRLELSGTVGLGRETVHMVGTILPLEDMSWPVSDAFRDRHVRGLVDWIRTAAAEQRGATPFKPRALSSSIISSHLSEFQDPAETGETGATDQIA
ncbi:unnamed protein product [Lampetra planeri]